LTDKIRYLSMEKEFKNIEKILSRLQGLQENHLESFDKKDLPDLEKQSVERNIEVEKLMKSVSDFVKITENKNSENTESMIHILNDRITTLLEQNKALETKVHLFRDGIKNEMKQVATGRKVIQSYQSSTAVSNNPNVISITN